MHPARLRGADRVECTMPEQNLVGYFTRLGPVGMYLQQADDQTRTRVIEVVRPAFASYVHGAEVCFNAACWLIQGRASSATAKFMDYVGSSASPMAWMNINLLI